MRPEIITEITPLSDKDCFYLIDRHKDSFTYPIHRHEDFELNFVTGAAGASRIVGDSHMTIGEFDLALIGGGIEHAWEQAEGQSSGPIREITIQFSRRLFGDTFLSKNQMKPIRDMLERSANGIAFAPTAIMRVFHLIDSMSAGSNDFNRMISLLRLLHELAISEGQQMLSSSSFAQATPRADSRRILKVKEYIDAHYRDEIHLEDLASLVGMTPSSFSRFFKLRTGKAVSDYIIEVRLGFASRILADTTHSIAEISYDCGFNNISYFNRVFKKRKGCSPKEFREIYKRNKVLV